MTHDQNKWMEIEAEVVDVAHRENSNKLELLKTDEKTLLELKDKIRNKLTSSEKIEEKIRAYEKLNMLINELDQSESNDFFFNLEKELTNERISNAERLVEIIHMAVNCKRHEYSLHKSLELFKNYNRLNTDLLEKLYNSFLFKIDKNLEHKIRSIIDSLINELIILIREYQKAIDLLEEFRLHEDIRHSSIRNTESLCTRIRLLSNKTEELIKKKLVNALEDNKLVLKTDETLFFKEFFILLDKLEELQLKKKKLHENLKNYLEELSSMIIEEVMSMKDTNRLISEKHYLTEKEIMRIVEQLNKTRGNTASFDQFTTKMILDKLCELDYIVNLNKKYNSNILNKVVSSYTKTFKELGPHKTIVYECLNNEITKDRFSTETTTIIRKILKG
ncbi:MAG: hypothetical protein N3E37_01330 [Candidatus Micrarchaeota archaeon]|nr:hypothetical protein [Candidatus Micrarchaeota archaeon]